MYNSFQSIKLLIIFTKYIINLTSVDAKYDYVRMYFTPSNFHVWKDCPWGVLQGRL